MKFKKIRCFLSHLAVAGACVSLVSADIFYTTLIGKDINGDPFIAPELQGDKSYGAWLDTGNFPGTGRILIEDGGTGDFGPDTGAMPGTKMWDPWPSQMAGSSAEIVKIANGVGGGPVRVSSNLYFGGYGTTPNLDGGKLAVRDLAPVTGLKTLILQIQIAEAWAYDFYQDRMPVLTYKTASKTVSNLTANYTVNILQFQNGTMWVPAEEGTEDFESGNLVEEPIYINAYALQWNLAEETEPITQFSISIEGAQHAQIHGIRIDQASGDHSGENLIIPPSSGAFANWISNYGLGKETGFNDDPNGDGVTNGMAFVLGGDPNVAGSTPMPEIVSNGSGGLEFQFSRQAQARGNARIVAEMSDDLINWPSSEHYEIGEDTESSSSGVVVSDFGDYDKILVALPQQGNKKFVRLRVEP